jgi:hypothetical protein
LTLNEEIMAKRANGYTFVTASTVAAASTAMTLWHRLPMLGVANAANAVEHQAECARMVDEKAAAFVEGWVNASMEMYRAFNAAAMGQFAPIMNAPLAIATAGMKPAFRRVNANAKRLNARAVRNALRNAP